MTTAFPDEWRPIAGWSVYQISDRGHVRRRPKGGRLTSKLTPLTVNLDGYQQVTLVRGTKEFTYRVDTLVCQAFHGKMPDKGMIVQHIDGVTWNNWASTIRWGYPIMATQWYSGPIGPARRGYFRYGPFKTKTEIMPNLKYGDVIVAFDDAGQIEAFEFVFSRDIMTSTRNPYDLVRYWRATAKRKLMEVECQEGMDMPVDPNQNPYEAAERYRKMAEMHPDYMWASYLLEAAFYLERMADCIYKDIPLPAPQTVSGVRRRLDIPRAAPVEPAQPVAPPPAMVRRQITAPADATPVQAPQTRAPTRRPVPRMPGFFSGGET